MVGRQKMGSFHHRKKRMLNFFSVCIRYTANCIYLVSFMNKKYNARQVNTLNNIWHTFLFMFCSTLVLYIIIVLLYHVFNYAYGVREHLCHTFTLTTTRGRSKDISHGINSRQYFKSELSFSRQVRLWCPRTFMSYIYDYPYFLQHINNLFLRKSGQLFSTVWSPWTCRRCFDSLTRLHHLVSNRHIRLLTGCLLPPLFIFL